MNEYYFTFGNQTVYRNRYKKVVAATESDARVIMDRDYPHLWSMVYLTAEAAGVDEFGLVPLATSDGCIRYE